MTSNVTLNDPLQGVLPMTPDSANRSHPATMSSFFEYLVYRTASSKLLEEIPFTSQWVHYNTPSGQDLTPASGVKDIGVRLSPDMNWSLQATIAAQNANEMPTGCSVSFQIGLKMCSLPFTRVLSVADSNTPVQ